LWCFGIPVISTRSPFSSQGGLDSITSRRRQAHSAGRQGFRRSLRRPAQKLELIAEPRTAATVQKVQAHGQPFPAGERGVHRLGRQQRNFLARKH
jgi:hypothetical protein